MGSGAEREEVSSWRADKASITIASGRITITAGGDTTVLTEADASRLTIRKGLVFWRVELDGQALGRVGRIPARELRAEAFALAASPDLRAAVEWSSELDAVTDDAAAAGRWITAEEIDALLARRPERGLAGRIEAAGYQSRFTEAELAAAHRLDDDVHAEIATVNGTTAEAEIARRRRFFDTIESSPLTDEQARAVVTFDNRVQVLAAAGSGKTSVMVGRAAYAVERGIVPAERILLLAFNRNAAEELDDRVSACFERAGIDPTGIKAATFHSLGRSIVGDVAEKMPDVAPWVERGQDAEEILRIAARLKESSDDFGYRWDLYRTLFGHAPTDLDTDEPDGWDREQSITGYRTFGGDIVRSHGERLIADFLFLNGVTYEYERPYDHSEATATRRQYRPDFYYPAIDTWHEHWALDRDGNPPASFHGYATDMEWKRDLHTERGTALIETTWADVVFGSGLADLKADLEQRGIGLNWNPDRKPADDWAKPLKDTDLARLIKTFMAHVKSNSSTRTDLENRLTGDQSVLAGYRTELFLGIFWDVYEQWQARLSETGTIDFADMLATAADHLEAGRYDSGWDLVLVDEFQDASAVRARLVRALVAKPGRYLLTVGDDWQAINRFAGADISVMTGFEQWFGPGPQLALTTTFRCSQQICDVARRFVSKNPRQFDKAMNVSRTEPGPSIDLVRSDDHQAAVIAALHQISAAATAEAIRPAAGDKVTVDVLGRYGFQRDLMPTRLPANLRVSFRTIHQSKGLEADCIIIPGLSTGTYGLPSNVRDDPVLNLAMPTAEPYPHAEERRLLYVALTRARHHVTLIAKTKQMSPFAVELLDDPDVEVAGEDAQHVEACPRCGQGTLAIKPGRYGEFLACTAFPRCRFTRSLPNR